MHSLVRRYIKTGIGFLALGLLTGAWMIVRREIWGVVATPYEISAHTHAILVGFVMMMILGVALWLFPRPARDDTRYSATRAEVAYWLVAGGTAVRFAGELLRLSALSSPARWAVVAGGLAQVAGIGVFFWTMWSRVRGVGSQVREARGEKF